MLFAVLTASANKHVLFRTELDNQRLRQNLIFKYTLSMILSSHATNARWEEFSVIAVIQNDESIFKMYKNYNLQLFTLIMVHHQKMLVYLPFSEFIWGFG